MYQVGLVRQQDSELSEAGGELRAGRLTVQTTRTASLPKSSCRFSSGGATAPRAAHNRCTTHDACVHMRLKLVGALRTYLW